MEGLTRTVECPFDRARESLGNVVELQHVNLQVPDPLLATAFYITALGLTRDPYLITGIVNMWANVGVSQFHLPTGDAAGAARPIGLVTPDLELLVQQLQRCAAAARRHKPTASPGRQGMSMSPAPGATASACHAPDRSASAAINLGMPYVEFDVATGTLPASPASTGEVFGAMTKVEKATAAARADFVGEQQ